MRIAIILTLIISSLSFSQPKKYLISPNQEVIPVGKETTKEIMDRYNRNRQQATSSQCTNYIGGYDPVRFPIDQNIGFYHKDVCGQWYVVPADGTIDTVYFHTLDQVGPSSWKCEWCMDSEVVFRIFSSNITPTSGPGVRPGPYRPPCTSWGYYLNTGDNENGIAAFVEDATPPQQSSWVPTNSVDSTPSFPPFGLAIWGLSGFPVTDIKPNTDIIVIMSDLIPLTVHKGDVIFIAFRIPSSIILDDATEDTRFEIGASDQNTPYPSRDWKFYEHDSGPTPSCGGLPSSQIKRGWVARGSFYADDSLAGAVYDIWFSMTPSSNTPPVISYVDELGNTLSTGPQKVTCTIYDCDASNASHAGVKEAYLRYSEDMGESWFTIPMTAHGIDQFEANLPGMNPTNTMDYKIVAEDSSGLSDSSFIYSYKVVELNSTGWYRIDTSISCTPAKISNMGTPIDTSQWFIAPRSFSNPTKPLRSDDGMKKPGRGYDGTAGPFPVSGGFVYYGDTMHFAWVGVNGAIALSKTATDTIDLNAAGFWTGTWDIPSPQHHSRSDTLHDKYIPKAFIAPYWADWINKLDSPLATFGHVRHFDDANKFVVEWDSLAPFNGLVVLGVPDISVYRVVLNKSDYSIEFQYDDIGYGGFDTLNLTGIQCDSNYHPQPAGQYPPFAFFNKNGYPPETHLHNGLCVHYVPVLFTMATSDGWNLLSLPSFYQNQAKTYLYPTAISPAFIYNGGYTKASTLANGVAFWLKFSGAQSQEVIGRALTCFDIPVVPGWNMIGSINIPVPVTSITFDPSTGIGPSTTFFYYSNISGWSVALFIYPGLGYWVHANDTGFIHLCPSGIQKSGNLYNELNTLNKITISQKSGGGQTLYIGSGSFDPDKYQMPPRAPEGTLDARFISNRMVEIYPGTLEDGKKYEYPIIVNASQYPLTIKWEEARNNMQKSSLTLKTDNGKALASLNGNGKITLNDASVKKLIVAVNAGIAIPKVFALSKNYPNPFNPTTQFTVSVPKTSQLDVSVYDILGRKIITLWNGEQSAGYHTMEWDGRDGQGLMSPTGLYFIRMNVPDEKFSAVQKIMLMK